VKHENILRFVEDLAAEYSDAARVDEGPKTLVKLPKVALPSGCNPAETSVLIVLEEQQPAPQLFVKQLPTLANGAVPRSTSAVPLAGETWHTFSFNQPWDENAHTAVQFVEGRLRRFALNE
jgi:hypothetical protein